MSSQGSARPRVRFFVFVAWYCARLPTICIHFVWCLSSLIIAFVQKVGAEIGRAVFVAALLVVVLLSCRSCRMLLFASISIVFVVVVVSSNRVNLVCSASINASSGVILVNLS